MATVEQVKSKMLDTLLAVDFSDLPIVDIEKYARALQVLSGVSNTPYWEGIYRGFCNGQTGGEA